MTGTSSSPSATVAPSSSKAQPKRRWAVSVKSYPLVTPTVAEPGSTVIVTGSMTFLYSTRPGEGVRSGKTRPSVTKLPSWSGSPKSPP